jgi:hypothetical protein
VRAAPKLLRWHVLIRYHLAAKKVPKAAQQSLKIEATDEKMDRLQTRNSNLGTLAPTLWPADSRASTSRLDQRLTGILGLKPRLFRSFLAAVEDFLTGHVVI